MPRLNSLKRIHTRGESPENEATVSTSENQRRDVFAEHTLHMGAGFKEQEPSHVLQTLSAPFVASPRY